MTLRAAPYFSKPADGWVGNVESLGQTRLFLVSRLGPSMFQLKDEEDQNFKITLGNPHKCSQCSNNNTGRGQTASVACIHILFCLVKVLRVSKDHPLCYQIALTDSEMEQVLTGQCSGQGARVSNIQSRLQRKHEKTKRDEAAAGSNDHVARMPLNDDDEENNCPICQDSMSDKEQALTWCRHGCGNNMHAFCMMKCAQHNEAQKKAVLCPLCREQWDVALLKLDCKAKRKKPTSKDACSSVKCYQCKCMIRRMFHRCLECSQKAMTSSTLLRAVDFCPDCFIRMPESHKNHHFLTSDASIEYVMDITWLGCRNPLVPIASASGSSLLLELQHRELSPADYDMLLSLDRRSDDIARDIVGPLLASLPVVDMYSNPRAGGCWCHAESSSGAANSHLQLVSLPCHHLAHTRCIKTDLDLIVLDDVADLVEYKCLHNNCGKTLFPCLNRRNRTVTAKGEESGSDNGKANESNKMNTGPMFLPELVGMKLQGGPEDFNVSHGGPLLLRQERAKSTDKAIHSRKRVWGSTVGRVSLSAGSIIPVADESTGVLAVSSISLLPSILSQDSLAETRRGDQRLSAERKLPSGIGHLKRSAMTSIRGIDNISSSMLHPPLGIVQLSCKGFGDSLSGATKKERMGESEDRNVAAAIRKDSSSRSRFLSPISTVANRSSYLADDQVSDIAVTAKGLVNAPISGVAFADKIDSAGRQKGVPRGRIIKGGSISSTMNSFGVTANQSHMSLVESTSNINNGQAVPDLAVGLTVHRYSV